jgi:hypothetical protein
MVLVWESAAGAMAEMLKAKYNYQNISYYGKVYQFLDNSNTVLFSDYYMLCEMFEYDFT